MTMRSEKIFNPLNQSGIARTSTAQVHYRASQLPGNGIDAIAKGLASLGKAANDWADFCRELDDDTDELELTKLNNEIKLRKAELDNAPITGQSDIDKFTGDWREYAGVLLEESPMSEKAKKKARLMIEDSCGTFAAAGTVALRRNQMIRNLGIQEMELNEAVSAADIDLASERYQKYSANMLKYTGKIPNITLEEIQSQAAANRFAKSVSGYGINALQKEIDTLQTRTADGSVREYRFIKKTEADRLVKGLNSARNIKIIQGISELSRLRQENNLNEASLRTLNEQGKISNDCFKGESSRFSTQVTAEKSAAARDLLKYQICNYDFKGKKPADIEKAMADFAEKIAATDMLGDDAALTYEYLEQCFDFDPKTGEVSEKAYRKSPVYIEARNFLKYSIGTPDSDYFNPWPVRSGDDIVTIDVDDNDDSIDFSHFFAENRANAIVMLDEFFFRNPNATRQEATGKINEIKEFISRQDVTDLANAWENVYQSITERKSLYVDSKDDDERQLVSGANPFNSARIQRKLEKRNNQSNNQKN